MPSSYRRYAVDYDRDGSMDLAAGAADAIGSIGHYLQAHGWTAGEIAASAVHISSAAARLVSGLERSHTVESLSSRGVRFAEQRLPDGPCSLVELPDPRAVATYWAGFHNFEAITRYNRSTFYAAAVLEFAAALRAARGAWQATATQRGSRHPVNARSKTRSECERSSHVPAYRRAGVTADGSCTAFTKPDVVFTRTSLVGMAFEPQGEPAGTGEPLAFAREVVAELFANFAAVEIKVHDELRGDAYVVSECGPAPTSDSTSRLVSLHGRQATW